MGGKPAFSTNSAVTSGTTVVSATRRTSATASSNAAAFVARMSTSSSHSGATTFGRVPPRTTPTFTVTPGQRPFSAWSAIVECAACSVADRPRSGSTPACAARPWYLTRMSATPLRADTMSPFSRAPSRTKQASISFASSRMCGPENGEPISSSGLHA